MIKGLMTLSRFTGKRNVFWKISRNRDNCTVDIKWVQLVCWVLAGVVAPDQMWVRPTAYHRQALTGSSFSILGCELKIRVVE